jgi:serine/threonine protein phosphatase 1
MRLLAIGDIHGCATALEALLTAVNPRAGDTIIGLGDYINKGPEAKATLDKLIQLFDRKILIPLRGNHELKLMAAGKQGKPQAGGEILVDQHTLDSYGDKSNPGTLASIPRTHWQFVEHHCLNWLETDYHIFVHATLDPGKTLAEQPDSALFFNKFNNPQPHRSDKTVVCGHTPQRNGHPLNIGHAICLDTATCEGQWLTCLDVLSGQVWQANQYRELRMSQIGDYLKNGANQRSLAATAL